jgi:hypothetical protein
MRSLAAALVIAACLAACAQSATAGDDVRHDLRVERAAARIAAAKIGELRGSHSHDADPMALIETYERPLRLKDKPRPVSGAIPPVVSNDDAPGPLLDPIATGSVRIN